MSVLVFLDEHWGWTFSLSQYLLFGIMTVLINAFFLDLFM
jgi:hypothetical protein